MITNNTFEKTSVTYPFVWWDRAFTEEQIHQITHYCNNLERKEGSVLGGEDIDKVRTSKVTFVHKQDDIAWFFDGLNRVIFDLNNQFYGFNLTGYDSFQYTEYYGVENGKYDWHMDTQLGNDGNVMPQPRKLSLTLLLNEPGIDFEGGDFEINMGNESRARVTPAMKGRIIAFPSFMIHRVAPVTKGVRKSIVVWVTGPKFV